MNLAGLCLEVAPRDFCRAHADLRARIYAGDPCARDTVTDLLRLILRPGGAFARGAACRPVVLRSAAGAPLAAAVLICAQRQPDILQVAFLEFAADPPDALTGLLEYARAQARHLGCRTLIAGCYGHVNNGLGIFDGPWDGPPAFGSVYHPPYYAARLGPWAIATDTLVTYWHDLARFPIAADRHLCARAARAFRVRPGRFDRLAEEIARYTALNNAAFAGHPHYGIRTPAEDLELFRAFGPLLREENFLVAEHQGRPVGFLLWYPDFNAWTPPGGRVGLSTVWRYRVLRRRPPTFKVAEVGVLPEYQRSGAILALIADCFARVRGRYQGGESGWIMDDNALSKALNTRWHAAPHKRYRVFHLAVEGSPP